MKLTDRKTWTQYKRNWNQQQLIKHNVLMENVAQKLIRPHLYTSVNPNLVALYTSLGYLLYISVLLLFECEETQKPHASARLSDSSPLALGKQMEIQCANKSCANYNEEKSTSIKADRSCDLWPPVAWFPMSLWNLIMSPFDLGFSVSRGIIGYKLTEQTCCILIAIRLHRNTIYIYIILEITSVQ